MGCSASTSRIILEVLRRRLTRGAAAFSREPEPSTPVRERHLFTSESVTEGHPDKICDIVSDSVLDAILAKDPRARVACETLVKTGFVVVAGEITTSAIIDVPTIVREAILQDGVCLFGSRFRVDRAALRAFRELRRATGAKPSRYGQDKIREPEKDRGPNRCCHRQPRLSFTRRMLGNYSNGITLLCVATSGNASVPGGVDSS